MGLPMVEKSTEGKPFAGKRRLAAWKSTQTSQERRRRQTLFA